VRCAGRASEGERQEPDGVDSSFSSFVVSSASSEVATDALFCTFFFSID
jgi:hypothetical protein